MVVVCLGGRGGGGGFTSMSACSCTASKRAKLSLSQKRPEDFRSAMDSVVEW